MNANDWLDLAHAACEHAGIEPGSIETVVTWDERYCANAVYRLSGQRYLKLFGPSAENQFHIERTVLRTLAGQRAIPAPRIVAEGERTGAPSYLVVTAIPGRTAEDDWEQLTRAEQLAVARDLGTMTAAIQRLPQAKLATVEQRFGGKQQVVDHYLPLWLKRVGATESLAPVERRDLMCFLQEEAQDHLDGEPVLSHFDLSHNHIYLLREEGLLSVSGIIDWGEAVLGPAEWDVSFLWFWTFSGDREAMRACLSTMYADSRPPDRFARRCLAAFFFTHGMGLVWPSFLKGEDGAGPIVRRLTAFLFPPALFGSPD